MSFVSSKDLDAVRENRRKARQKLLNEEEAKYLAKEKARKRHIESGNDKWMLPGIERRIEAESVNVVDVASSKKHKKSKKKKKKKKKSSSGSSDSDEDDKWEEKHSMPEENIQHKEPENWLNFDDVLGNGKTYTSKDLKEQKEAEKKLPTREDELVGNHAKELNPFWKDGGKGLPAEKQEKVVKTTNKVHKEWLLKSLKRMTEQAQEQDRNIEDIASERYGSWEEFQRMLREAEPERERRGGKRGERYREPKLNFMRPNDDDESHGRRKGFLRPGDDDDDDRESRRDRKHKKDRHRGRDYKPSWKKSTKDDSRDDSKRSERSPSPHSSSRRRSDKEEKRKIQKSRGRSRSQERSDTSKNSSNVEAGRSPPKETTTKVYTVEKPPNVLVISKESGGASKSKILKEKAKEIKPMTEKEKNQIAAKILKAELMGNEKLAQSLKFKLEKAREAEASVKEAPKRQERAETVGSESGSSDEETVVLTRVGKDGQQWPLKQSEMSYGAMPQKKRKKTKLPTHKGGERERYFADDDRHSLEDLVRREKTMEAEDQHGMLSRLASKQFQGTDSEYFTLDDMYVSEASRRNTRTEEEARQKQKAIADHKKLARRLEKCRLCFGNPELPKHLLIAIGKKCYLSLPDHKPLTEGHCIIVPMHHCNTGTGLDEDVWSELRQFMRVLQFMFKSQDKDCVFMQTCIGLKKSRHFFVDCIPLPQEEGDMAPIYFKKAIQESESEWSHNKKLVDTRGKDVLRCIPKGLPYFSVDFGMDGGFAHVVEDEDLFPFYFGREIVGGMLDVEPRLWRHPPKDHFTEQTKRSLQFSEWWKPHDWTSNISSTS